MRVHSRDNEPLRHAPPLVSAETARAVAFETFGLEGKVTGLGGELDRNFRLDHADGRRYVLKFNSSAPDAVIDEQNDILFHLEKLSSIVAPRVHRSLSGQGRVPLRPPHSNGRMNVRALTYVDGQTVKLGTSDPQVITAIGKQVAALTGALEAIGAQGEREFLWDLRQAQRLYDLLPAIEDDERRKLVAETIERFEKSVLPVEADLPRQVAHNDLSPRNMVVLPEATGIGIIDFGDSIRTWRICELAIAASYFLDPDDPELRALHLFLRAYSQDVELTEAEQNVLAQLTLLRVAQVIAVSEWRASANPDDRQYILHNNARASRNILRYGRDMSGLLGIVRAAVRYN